MKKIILILFFSQSLFGWGFWSHKKISEKSIEILPTEMKYFFSLHKDYIIENSVAPDKWRFRDKSEGAKHYIDLDRYGNYPFEMIPKKFEIAIEKYSLEKINENGTLPWIIEDFTEKLTIAFKQKDKEKILYYASWLAHYVSDAHVPLHTTENYNGQFTNQHGLHARWETEIPKKFGNKFELNPIEPKIISKINAETFRIVLDSYQNLERVLESDKFAQYDEKGLPTFKPRKNNKGMNFSKKYYQIFYKRLNRLVENRMEKSISSVASFWMTSWINAGKPNLN